MWYMKLPNGSTNLPTETVKLSTKKNYKTKEILSSTKLPTYSDQLITKNNDKSTEFLSSANLPINTDQFITINTDMTKEIPSSANLPIYTSRVCKNKIQTDIIKKKINKRKISKETIISNGNVWKKDGKRTRCERKTNKGYHEEKDSRV